MERGDTAASQLPPHAQPTAGGATLLTAAFTFCTAAAAVCATRDRDRLEATEYCTDCNEIWRLTKPHPAQRQYFAAEQISCNTHHFPFP